MIEWKEISGNQLNFARKVLLHIWHPTTLRVPWLPASNGNRIIHQNFYSWNAISCRFITLLLLHYHCKYYYYPIKNTFSKFHKLTEGTNRRSRVVNFVTKLWHFLAKTKWKRRFASQAQDASSGHRRETTVDQ